MFEQYCHRAGFEPDVAFELEDIGVCEPLVAAGECIALMPALFVSRPHPQVAIRPLRDGPPAREIMAIWIPARRVAAIEPLANARRSRDEPASPFAWKRTRHRTSRASASSRSTRYSSSGRPAKRRLRDVMAPHAGARCRPIQRAAPLDRWPTPIARLRSRYGRPGAPL